MRGLLFSLSLLLVTSPGLTQTSVNDLKELGAGPLYTPLYYHYPPDPVNPHTLNFYLPEEHLSLPCYMPIEIKAAYNSYSGESSIFGQKWTFNHNIRIRAAGTKYEVLEADGFWNPYTREKSLAEAKNHSIEQLIVAKKKIDSQKGGLKAASVYEDYRRQLNSDSVLLENEEAKYLSHSQALGPGKYYSFARGPSTLIMKGDGTFARTFQNGSVEYFNKSGRIIKTVDRNSNYMAYIYDGNNNLVRINDMCGRYVSFGYKQDKAFKNLVDVIRDSVGREVRYDYYPGRRLKSVLDATKKLTEYAYDKAGNMTSISTTMAGKKNVITLRYNPKYEVESEEGPGTNRTEYLRTFVANNQSHSITTITKFEAGRQTGREVLEYKTGEFESTTNYDAAGAEVSKKVQKFSQQTGYPVSILDGRGYGDLFNYDADTGNLLKRESIPSHEGMEFEYDKRCNQVNKMKLLEGKIVKSSTTFSFDNRCNLTEAVETQGQQKKVWISLQYSPQGKIIFMRDRIANKEVGFKFWKYGKPESITLKDTGTLLVKYSPFGDIENVDTFPSGKGKIKYKNVPRSTYQNAILAEVKGSLDFMLNYLRPAGLNIGL